MEPRPPLNPIDWEIVFHCWLGAVFLVLFWACVIAGIILTVH